MVVGDGGAPGLDPPPGNVPGGTAREQYSEIRYDAIALRLMPMNRTDSPGLCSPASPGWYSPTTPWRFSPVRSRITWVLPFSSGTLSDGMIGSPRQVMNCEPNR